MGLCQKFKVSEYNWDVHIYYVLDFQQRNEIIKKISQLSKNQSTIDSVKINLDKADLDTGLTYSGFDEHLTIMVIHKASSIAEFLNTLVHEKNHLEMHMCEALDINPYSEEAAHLSGNLAQQMFEDALESIVEL